MELFGKRLGVWPTHADAGARDVSVARAGCTRCRSAWSVDCNMQDAQSMRVGCNPQPLFAHFLISLDSIFNMFQTSEILSKCSSTKTSTRSHNF